MVREGWDGGGLKPSGGDTDAAETHVVWRESRSGVFVGEEPCAEVGGVKEAGVLGGVVGVDELSEVDEEAPSVGCRNVTRGIGRSGAVTGPGAGIFVLEAIVSLEDSDGQPRISAVSIDIATSAVSISYYIF